MITTALVRGQRRLGQVGDFEVFVEDQAEGGVSVRRLVALRLLEQLAELSCGGGLVGARLPEAALLASDRVGPGVDTHAECPAGQPLNVSAPGLGHDGYDNSIGASVPLYVPRRFRNLFELSL